MDTDTASLSHCYDEHNYFPESLARVISLQAILRAVAWGACHFCPPPFLVCPDGSNPSSKEEEEL